MPPPRRRRPVQPATRVRIPRTARSRATPADESADGRLPVTEAPGNGLAHEDLAQKDLAHEDLGGPESTVDDLAQDETAGNDLVREEQDSPALAAREAAGAEPAGDETVHGEPAADEAAADQAAGDDTVHGESARDETTAEEPTADETAAEEPTADQTTADQTTAAQPTAAQPTADQAAADQAATAAEPKAARGPSRHPLLLPAALGVLAVILGGLAVWFGLQASSATSGVDASNTALTDPAATRQVTQQVTSAVNKIFSYNYADTAQTSQAAAALLTGKARQQYDTLFKLVRLDAPKEKLILTTTVTSSGVEFLDGNQARLLIFADQRDTSGAAHKTTDAGAMFAVNAVNQGGRWKISSIDTFHPGG